MCCPAGIRFTHLPQTIVSFERKRQNGAGGSFHLVLFTIDTFNASKTVSFAAVYLRFCKTSTITTFQTPLLTIYGARNGCTLCCLRTTCEHWWPYRRLKCCSWPRSNRRWAKGGSGGSPTGTLQRSDVCTPYWRVDRSLKLLKASSLWSMVRFPSKDKTKPLKTW